jgi:hypothetical protein
VREEFASHRATSSTGHAWATTTALWCAGTKVSPAEIAKDSVAGVSAPGFVN